MSPGPEGTDLTVTHLADPRPADPRCRRWATRARGAGRWLIACVCLGLAAGCAGSTTVPVSAIIPLTMPERALSRTATQGVERQLRAEVNFWLGTPYRRGGTSRRGIDCSGFVQQIYRSAFAIDLPRTAAEQGLMGNPVPLSDLQPGDLLYFRIRESRNHVGIYLGGDDFVHASPRRGVSIASLSAPHWQQAFQSARRLPRG